MCHGGWYFEAGDGASLLSSLPLLPTLRRLEAEDSQDLG